MKYQLLPPLSQAEYEALRDDIAAAGIRQPIDVDENGDILDGHHRKRIADELGIECPERVVRGLQEFEKADYALTVNAARRHLDRDGKRELVKASLKLHPRLSDREHARRCGVTHPTVAGVREVMVLAGQLESFTTRTGTDGKTYAAQRDPIPPQIAEEIERRIAEKTRPFPPASETDVDHPHGGEAHAELGVAVPPLGGDVEASGAATPDAGAEETAGTASSIPTPAELRTAGVGDTSELAAVDYMARFTAALAKSGAWMQFDPERVAELASSTTWDAIEAHAEVVAHTFDRMRKARRTLRVLPGGAA